MPTPTHRSAVVVRLQILALFIQNHSIPSWIRFEMWIVNIKFFKWKRNQATDPPPKFQYRFESYFYDYLYEFIDFSCNLKNELTEANVSRVWTYIFHSLPTNFNICKRKTCTEILKPHRAKTYVDICISFVFCILFTERNMNVFHSISIAFSFSFSFSAFHAQISTQTNSP